MDKTHEASCGTVKFTMLAIISNPHLESGWGLFLSVAAFQSARKTIKDAPNFALSLSAFDHLIDDGEEAVHDSVDIEFLFRIGTGALPHLLPQQLILLKSICVGDPSGNIIRARYQSHAIFFN